ncbi:hypothetical protein PPERSA_08477 [Pseudocohnilembus persalinus]|uniref:Uncharacterized protein n=1 Tax=Pseudocohnilembus persalinus TaxID=266149 RepID=A0A0V0R6U4_PSEPJ|nr:hypothetical protein PPERSA_08477 [Pseudocohnilembus persalinus]|eukprot:KRX10074.1 hypothetical protein PPERSA_08477 [Pseudocohnilembus persalinus]
MNKNFNKIDKNKLNIINLKNKLELNYNSNNNSEPGSFRRLGNSSRKNQDEQQNNNQSNKDITFKNKEKLERAQTDESDNIWNFQQSHWPNQTQDYLLAIGLALSIY